MSTARYFNFARSENFCEKRNIFSSTFTDELLEMVKRAFYFLSLSLSFIHSLSPILFSLSCLLFDLICPFDVAKLSRNTAQLKSYQALTIEEWNYLLVNIWASGWGDDKTTPLTSADVPVSSVSRLYISGWARISVSAGMRILA